MQRWWRLSHVLIAGVGADANNLKPARGVGAFGAYTKALADGIDVGEKSASERVVDDGYPRGVFGILRGEGSASKDRDGHHGEKLRAYISHIRCVAVVSEIA